MSVLHQETTVARAWTTTGIGTGSEQRPRSQMNAFPATAMDGAANAGSTRSCTTTPSREVEENVWTARETEEEHTARSAKKTRSPPLRRTPREGRSASCATAIRMVRQTSSAGTMGSANASQGWQGTSATSALPTTGTSPLQETLLPHLVNAWSRAVLETGQTVIPTMVNASANKTLRGESATDAGPATSRSTWTTTLVAPPASASDTPLTVTPLQTISKA